VKYPNNGFFNDQMNSFRPINADCLRKPARLLLTVLSSHVKNTFGKARLPAIFL